MAGSGYHYGTSDGVRALAKRLVQSVRTMIDLSKTAQNLLNQVEEADKGGSYQEARRVYEDVVKTINAGLEDVSETYQKMNKYADFLESIGK